MKKIFTLVLILLTTVLYAQQDGDLDLNFVTGGTAGANGEIRKVITQPDGKILISGSFTAYNGVARNKIVRLNIDGTVDATFNPVLGFDYSSISVMALQTDGKIVIPGRRLNSDGTLDNSFAITPFLDYGSVGSTSNFVTLGIQSDGKIIAGGSEFNDRNGAGVNAAIIYRYNVNGILETKESVASYEGVYDVVSSLLTLLNGKILIFVGGSTSKLIRFNADGSGDNSFSSKIDGSVISLAQQNDGKVVLGGYFSTYNGVTKNGIVRLNTDGSIDNSFNTGSGTNGGINSIAIQSDGKIMIGGRFSTYNGITTNNIVRLNTDGSLDNSFNAGSGTDGNVNSIALQSDGRVIMIGDFSHYNGIASSKIVRIDKTGNFNSSLSLDLGADNGISTAISQSDGKIVISGYFTTYNSQPRNGIARINPDGSIDNSFNPMLNTSVLAAALQADGKILIAKVFDNYSTNYSKNLIRVNSDGTLDNSFQFATTRKIIGITDVKTSSDGKIIIQAKEQGVPTRGGYYQTYSILKLNLDGSIDKLIYGDNITFTEILAQQASGSLIVRKDSIVVSSSGSPTSYIGYARLNPDLSLDTKFTLQNVNINTVVVQSDNKIIIGGEFNSYFALPRNRLVRLNENGSIDMSFDPGVGPDAAVQKLALQADGKIIVSGLFKSYNGITKKGICRINSNGTLDNLFDAGEGSIGNYKSANILSNGKIILTGDFTSFNNVPRNRIAQLLTYPNIQLRESNNNISNKGNYVFTSTGVGTKNLIAFTLSDIGVGQLSLTGNPQITFSGANASDFTINQTVLPTTLNYNQTTTFSVTFTPTALGNRIAQLSILNNSSVNPFIINLEGVGIKNNQTITFNALAQKTFGDAPFTLSATASSGLPVTYVSSNTAVATISGNTVTIVGSGTATITASQAGNGSYNAAADVAQTFTVLTPGPVAIAATAASNSGFTANWQAITGITDFFIDVSTSELFSTFISGYQDKSVSGTSFALAGLSDGNTYYYRLRARKNGVLSVYSNSVSVSTLLNAPSQLTSSVTTTGSSATITLNWKNNSSAAPSFKVERSTGNVTSFSEIASTGNNATSFQDNNVPTGSTYYYRIRAFLGNNVSAYSNTIGASPVANTFVTALPGTAGQGVRFYPNPTDGFIYIEGVKELSDFVVYDLLGKSVHSGRLPADKPLDCSALSAGNYVLVIKNKSGVYLREKVVLVK